MLDAECSWWKRYTRHGAQALFVERYGHIRSEKLLGVFLEMTRASKAKKEAMAWFVAHAEHARGFVEDQERSGDAAAKAVLKAMG